MNRKRKVLCLDILIGTVVILTMAVVSKTNTYNVNTVCLWVMATVYYIIILYFGLYIYAKRQWDMFTIKQRTVLVVATISVAVTMFLILPFRLNDILRQNFLEKEVVLNNEYVISAVGEKNAKSSGYDVQIESVQIDGRDKNLYELVIPSDWQYVDDRPFYSSDKASHINISFDAENMYNLAFRTGPSAGVVEIKKCNKVVRYDLYSENQGQRNVEFNDLIDTSRLEQPSIFETLLYNVAYMFVIFVLTTIVLTFFVNLIIRERRLDAAKE